MKLPIPHLKYEQNLGKQGIWYVAGLDEVGRGAWAGPLVSCAVIMRSDLPRIYKIRDSKILSKDKREALAEKIKLRALTFGIGIVDSWEIEELGISRALNLAGRKAIGGLSIQPQFVLIDGFQLRGIGVDSQAIKGGDKLCFSIAAASIIAKVTRDKIMGDFHRQYPQYRFDLHKGYGTKLHQKMLEKYGPCSIHRKNYKPIKSIFNKYIKQ